MKKLSGHIEMHDYGFEEGGVAADVQWDINEQECREKFESGDIGYIAGEILENQEQMAGTVYYQGLSDVELDDWENGFFHGFDQRIKALVEHGSQELADQRAKQSETNMEIVDPDEEERLETDERDIQTKEATEKAQAFKVGDKVKLTMEGLKQFGRSIPAHASPTREWSSYFKHLSSLYDAESIGTVERVFDSKNMNVDFDGEMLHIYSYMIAPSEEVAEHLSIKRESYGPEDLDEEADRVLEEQSFIEDTPSEGDYVLSNTGPLGAKTSVGVVDGDFLGEFNSEDTAMEAIQDDMRKNDFYPNIWRESDHGNLIRIEGSKKQAEKLDSLKSEVKEYFRIDLSDDQAKELDSFLSKKEKEFERDRVYFTDFDWGAFVVEFLKEKKLVEDKGQSSWTSYIANSNKQAAFDYELHNWNTQEGYHVYSSFMDYLTETSPDDYDKKTLQQWYSKILKVLDKEDRNTLKDAWSQELNEWKKESSKKVALELWKHPKDYYGETYEDYYVGPGQHRDSEVLDRANFIAALEMLGGEHDPDVIVARAGHWGVGWVESILVHKDSDKVPVLEEIEKKIADYPVLDDDLYSKMQYEEFEESYESWAKDEAIKELELEEQDGGFIDPDGLIISEDDLHTIVVDLLSEGYSTSDTEELINKFNEVAKPTEQKDKQELEEGGQEKLPLEGNKKAVLEGGGAAIWDALPEADRKEQLKEIGVLKPEVSKKEWLELPPITRQRLEEKFKTKPTALEVGKRYKVQRPNGIQEYNLTNIQGNLAELMDDAGKKFSAPLATLESGVAKGQVVEAYSNQVKEYCPNCQIPLRNIGKDGAIQLRDCPRCSRKVSTFVENPYKNEKKAIRMVPEDYQALKDTIFKALDQVTSDTGKTLETIHQEYKDAGLSDMRFRWDIFWKSKFNNTPVYNSESFKEYNDTHIDTALKNILVDYYKTKGKTSHKKEAKWNLTIPFNFIGDLVYGEEDPTDEDAVNAGQQAAAVLQEYKGQILEQFPDAKEKDIDGFIGDFSMVDDIRGFDYTMDNLRDYADHYGILLNQAPSSFKESSTKNEVIEEMKKKQDKFYKEDPNREKYIKNIVEKYPPGKKQAYISDESIQHFIGQAIHYLNHYTPTITDFTDDDITYYVAQKLEERIGKPLSPDEYGHVEQMVKSANTKEAAGSEQEHIKVYFNDAIDMSGKGIEKIELDGEEIPLEELVQAIYEEISGSGLPEVYDMSIYIGSPYFGALDIMWDYDTSIVPDEKVEAVQDMFDKKFKREFIQTGGNEKESSKEGSSMKEAADTHTRYCQTCGKRAGIHSDKSWKDKREMCADCNKDYERNEKPKKKNEPVEEPVEMEKKESSKDILEVVFKDENGQVTGKLSTHQFMNAIQAPKTMSVADAIKKHNEGSKEKAELASMGMSMTRKKESNHKGSFVYEIKPEDVGKPTIKINGRPRMVTDFLGRILSQDVGKRIYENDRVLQVENQEQLEKRLEKGSEKEAKSSVDPHAARELKLYIENDGDLNSQMVDPIRKNLIKKIEKGIFDFDRSIQAWMNLADYAAHKYISEFNPGMNIKTMFSKATRWETAKGLATDFAQEYKNGELDYLKKQPKEPQAPIQEQPKESSNKQAEELSDDDMDKIENDLREELWYEVSSMDDMSEVYDEADIKESLESEASDINFEFEEERNDYIAGRLEEEIEAAKQDWVNGQVDKIFSEKYPDYTRKYGSKKEAVNFTAEDKRYRPGYFKEDSEHNTQQDLYNKAEEVGLMDMENEDLTAEGLLAKMYEWDESEHGVDAYIYDETKKDLESHGASMPEDIRRIEGKKIAENCFCGNPPAEGMQGEEHPLCEEHLKDVEQSKDELLKDWPKESSKKQAESDNFNTEFGSVTMETGPDGLTLRLREDFNKEELKQALEEKGEIALIGEFFENLFANSSWREVDPEDIGALTSAPILGDDVNMNDQGDITSVGNVYWYPDYQVKSFFDDLIEDGTTFFTLAPEDETEELDKESSKKTADAGDEEEKKEALAKFLGISAEDVVYEGHNFEASGGEYDVYTDDEADRVVFSRVKDDLEQEPSLFNQDWLERFIYITDTDKHMIALDMAASRMEDMPEEDIVREANLEDDEEYQAAVEADDTEAMARIIDEAKERVEESMIENVENALEDPIQYFVHDEGLFSIEDLFKQNFISIDVDEAVQDAIDTDGRGRFLSGYDGEENEEEVNGTMYFIYRTN